MNQLSLELLVTVLKHQMKICLITYSGKEMDIVINVGNYHVTNHL